MLMTSSAMLHICSTLMRQVLWLNESINQISIAPISLAKSGSVAQQPNLCSTAKLKKAFHNINGPSGVPVSIGESQKCVFRCFLKVATEMAEWTDSTRLFQTGSKQMEYKSEKLAMFLEGSNWNGWMNRQYEVVPNRWSTRVKSSRLCWSWP